MENSNRTVQDEYLMEVKENKTPVVVYMMNGFQMRGKIKDFDLFTIRLEKDGIDQLLYKHAVSTVSPDIRGESSQKGPSSQRQY